MKKRKREEIKWEGTKREWSEMKQQWLCLVVKELTISTYTFLRFFVCAFVRDQVFLEFWTSERVEAHSNPSWLPGTRFVLSFISPPIYSARCFLSPPFPTFHSFSHSRTLYLPLSLYTPPDSSFVNSPRIITFCHCL